MQLDLIDSSPNTDGSPANRRRHFRSVFTFPVELELLSQKPEGITFTGYLKDISMGGAGLEMEDSYGRFNVAKAENGTVRLTISIPRENKVHLFAHVRWVKKVERTYTIKMGISFKDLDYETSKTIEKLIGLKGKDHTMIWNLWEQHFQ